MKKLMCLGGNYFQMTAVLAAKRLGIHVIDVDYLPENPAHEIADEYYNISIIEKEKILELARHLEIDGILSYASDVGAPTAAYVAEQLGLPTNPYESVRILTDKNRFRDFLEENGYLTPAHAVFCNQEKALDFASKIGFPVMVKPVDSSGSKGVFCVNCVNEFATAFNEALSYSRSNVLIIEKYVESQGYQIDGDGFLIDGVLRYFGVMDQHKDARCDPFTSVASSIPSLQAAEHQEKAHQIVQEIVTKLNMKMGGLNIEYIVTKEGEIQILEIAPRSGGNLISDTIKYSNGVDLATGAVKTALGISCEDILQKGEQKCVSSYIIPSPQSGIFKELMIDDRIKEDILQQWLFVSEGETVEAYCNAGNAVGAMVIQFNSLDEMDDRLEHMGKYIRVMLE